MCVRACVRVPMFNNDSYIGLRCDSCVSGTILGNRITYVHNVHGPCSYFQRVM